jgi:hypothetical protein
MDDGAALVQEVLEELPMENKGEREEWKVHQGWHRREDTHRNPVNMRHLPPKVRSPAQDPHAPASAHTKEFRKEEKEEEAEEEQLLPPTAVDIDVKKEAAIRQRIHEDLVADKGADDLAAINKSSEQRASTTTNDANFTKQHMHPDKAMAPGSLSQEGHAGTPSPHPSKGEQASRPHLRGGAVLLPRSQDYPEEHAFGFLWSSSWTQWHFSGIWMGALAFVLGCCCLVRQSANGRGRLKRHRG